MKKEWQISRIYIISYTDLCAYPPSALKCIVFWSIKGTFRDDLVRKFNIDKTFNSQYFYLPSLFA